MLNIRQHMTVANFSITLFVAIGYFLAGKLSFSLLTVHEIVTIVIFASEGIALASALYFGKKVWVGVFIGQFILAQSTGLSILPSFEISIINALEIILGVILFDKYKLNRHLLSLRDVLGLLLLITFILQPFSALLGNLILLINNIITSQDFFSSLFSWWFGNIMGQLLFTPSLLLLLLNYKKIDLFQYLGYGIFFALFLYILEVELALQNLSLLLSFTIPVAIFIVSKKGLTYGTLLTNMVAIISSYSVYVGVGAFSLSSIIDNIININFFILAHISVVFIAGALFEEKEQKALTLHDMIAQEVEKNKEQQLLMLQQNRLAQMGEMISMIAHQWRQPLNLLSIMNQTIIHKYQNKKLDDEVVQSFKNKSSAVIQQMSTTIDDFSNFFKPEKEKVLFCINDIVTHVSDITTPIYVDNQITLTINIPEKYYTFGYPNELGQSILNIINNAKDALLDNNREERKIILTLTKKESYLILSIADNAGGIPLDIINKVFDPYFSTKINKNGTGLGLYISKIIIDEHMQGKLSVSNTQDGACFQIQLNHSCPIQTSTP
jgi:signal transduction histidine kinase